MGHLASAATAPAGGSDSRVHADISRSSVGSVSPGEMPPLSVPGDHLPAGSRAGEGQGASIPRRGFHVTPISNMAPNPRLHCARHPQIHSPTEFPKETCLCNGPPLSIPPPWLPPSEECSPRPERCGWNWSVLLWPSRCRHPGSRGQ